MVGYGSSGSATVNLSHDDSSCREKRRQTLNILRETVVKWNGGREVDEFHDIRPKGGW